MPGSRQKLRPLFLALATLSLAGCVEITQLVRLRGDGSGEIVQTVQMSPAFLAAMEASGAETDGAGDADWREGLAQAAQEARDNPGAFGEGVTFVSVEPIGTDETPGMRLTLAFTDIARVDLEPFQTLGSAAATPVPSGEEANLRFRLDRRRGGRSVLTAVFLEPAAHLTSGPDAAAPVPKIGPKAALDGKGAEELGRGLLEMLETVLTGMRVTLAVEVPELLATSSPYVAGNTVTLLELDMDRLLADSTKLAALGESGDTSLAAMRELFTDVPGVKLPPASEVTIEFSD